MNTNLLTFDIEDWYEGYRFRGISGWEDIKSHDVSAVENLLELLSKKSHSATFFFTGRFAAKNRNLVRQCIALGHEVASHSQEHNLITSLTQEEFRHDLKCSLETLSDITGKKIIGYRAPKWSVTRLNENWFFNELIDAGIKYDSSFFPKFRSDALRRSGEILEVQSESKGSLIEIPAPGLKVFDLVLPVAGGFYFRVLPFWIIRRMLMQRQSSSTYSMIYMHPYDLDSTSAKEAKGNPLLKLSRTYGVDNVLNRLEWIMNNYHFTSIEKSLPALRPVRKINIGSF